MTQIEHAWGSGPSARYEALATPFRPILQRIRATAVERDNNRILPFDEIGWLREAGFPRLRLPVEHGGAGATLPELFGLIIELGAADTSVTNALRSHLGFTEDILNAAPSLARDAWLKRLGGGETIGSGFSELGEGTVGTVATRLSRRGDHWVLNGRKFYTSGSLYADWINLGAVTDTGETVGALVPTKADGVTILDDWDGFGQILSASGTAIFSDVALTDDHLNPVRERFRYTGGFFQLVHLATLAGIGRAGADEVAQLVKDRKRSYPHANADLPAADPQVLQIVGRVRGAAYAAGAIVLKAAEALERTYQARLSGDAAAEEEAGALADLEVSQSVTVVTDIVLEATTLLFDALGASAARKSYGLDRHWRNARTISSHNPRIYHHRAIGEFAVNGTWPERNWGRALRPAPAGS
ncbi:acyl-CoA dehydrogenase family protein [Chelatococcus asaccharovorans]|uniref:Dibenzothiophene monooxygenase n=1 Tax=Chelatococcus asaccharovorans TaxID=28210 RepID=A0A2V3U751_9HYPH|nr:acyl-CoA dehydrogenase family protein [Chelatococcus asaccharovorans]MBS7703772.1 acyl-CoA dehydrogenase family protein [Chelatococcus asaccharovorans]PXW57932.1 alkylation response protein AidB-like acyl-CoA dehydrogenase [Chelatococcus asaccharovorans]